jgi:methionine synthase II (cobalamin-independent)
MTDYNPRTDTGIPTEPVGSLPRPAKLQAAYAEYDAGNISKEDLEKEQEASVKDSIERFESTGSPIISDGEQRWSSFATYPITDTLAGTGLAENLGPGGQFFAIFADGHGRQLPKLTGGPLKYAHYAADSLTKSLPYANKPMKQAVIAPSMIALLYPLKDPVPGYSREEFEEDIVQECVTDIRKSFEAGAARVSIDFTEGRLATREDPRNPWTGAGLLPHFIELNNRVLANFSDEERKKIGIHTCPGGDRDSVHSADVPYNNLLPEMFKINAGYFLIQLSSERDRDPVYESVGQHSRDDQMCYIGVTNPLSPRPESAQEICDAIVRAADFIPKERLGTTDDCGFSPFSIDEKPNHGSPDYAREIAFQKIANRVEGTRRAAEKLGVG